MSLFVKFNLILILVFALALVPVAYISNSLLQKNARTQIVQVARIMMQSALATRGYTNKQIKPLLASRLADEFLPQSVPSYSATEIFNNLRENNPEYTYKEATLNPTNPRDRTADWEADLVHGFRNDPARKETVGERDTPEGRTLFLAHPIVAKDEKCLVCHSTPDVAPASMVKLYGSGNGFGWKLGEIIGAQIVSVPMSLPVRLARQALGALLLSLAGVFVFTLVVLNILLHFAVIQPLRQLTVMADTVSNGDMSVPDLKLPGRDEVARLAASFGRMRISLKKAIDLLEES